MTINKTYNIYLLIFFILLLTHCKNNKNNNQTKNHPIYTVFYLPGDSTIFVGSTDQWHFDSGLNLIDSITMRQDFIGTIPCSENTNIILKTCKNGSIYIKEYEHLDSIYINIENNKEKLYEISDYVDTNCEAPNVLHYEIKGKQNSIKNPNKSIFRFAWFSDNTNILLAVDIAGFVYKIDITTNTIINYIKLSTNNLNCIHSDINNKQIVVSAKDSIYVLDINLTVVDKIFIDSSNVYVSFILKNNSIISCTENGILSKLTKNESSSYKKEVVKKLNTCIYAMHFNSKNNNIITGGQDGYIKIWDAKTLELLQSKYIYE